MKVVGCGAEAILYIKDGNLIKERLKKGYRIGELDASLRRSRTRKEAKLIREARRAGVAVPSVIGEKEFELEMEFVEGEKVRDILGKGKKNREICAKIGEAAGKLHEAGIIHGDLTTSNMLLRGEDLVLIDFGLGFQSQRIEDKAVDLRLLKEALDSTHWEVAEKAWKIILKAYQNQYSEAGRVLSVLREIEKRGRYAKR